uniref:Uncharacterized protein n=1 Tax=Zea mays TaxID=4577 RepID=A0A804UJJ9_MAIZE
MCPRWSSPHHHVRSRAASRPHASAFAPGVEPSSLHSASPHCKRIASSSCASPRPRCVCALAQPPAQRPRSLFASASCPTRLVVVQPSSREPRLAIIVTPDARPAPPRRSPSL